MSEFKTKNDLIAEIADTLQNETSNEKIELLYNDLRPKHVKKVAPNRFETVKDDNKDLKESDKTKDNKKPKESKLKSYLDKKKYLGLSFTDWIHVQGTIKIIKNIVLLIIKKTLNRR